MPFIGKYKQASEVVNRNDAASVGVYWVFGALSDLWLSVQALARERGAVESFAGGDHREIKLFE